MVFFTCNGCGESVKKASVEKHRLICRRSYTISCMDCGKDFNGQEYQAHTKCISEAQKYDMTGEKPLSSKGDVKQQLWTEQVQRAIDSAETSDRRLISGLQQLRDYPNIPRKKAKFKNFLINSLRIHNPLLIDQLWDAISSAELAAKANGQANNNEGKSQLSNGNVSSDASAVCSKEKPEAGENGVSDKGSCNESKHKATTNGSSVTSETETSTSVRSSKKLKIKPILKRILTEAPNNEMKFKKLKKMVFSAIPSDEDEALTKDIVYSIVERKVSNSSRFLVNGKMVRLVGAAS